MPLLWHRSRAVEFDENGERASGAIAQFLLAGTTTPLTVYQDAGLTTPHEQTADGSLDGDSVADEIGRWPSVWIPFSASGYKERAISAGGTLLWTEDNIPRLDPVEAAGDTVDATQLITTGDVIWCPADETRTGFVRLNGRTIGSATSGATERANADTENLFLYYWNKMANGQAAVSGGRGASAAADWAANKTITLLNGRSGVLRGLSDMGNTSDGLLASAPVTNGDAVSPGSILGLNTYTILTANLPAYTPAGTVNISGTITFPSNSQTVAVNTPTGSISFNSPQPHDHTYTTNSSLQTVQSGTGVSSVWTGTNTISTGTTSLSASFSGNSTSGSFNQNILTATWAQASGSNPGGPNVAWTGTAQGGSSTAHNIVSRSILGTYYQKL